MDKHPIRRMRVDEIQTALDMIWKVYEAPDYTAQGVRSFRSYLDDKEKIRQLTFYGEMLVGTICLHPPQHIDGIRFTPMIFREQEDT
ncbi:MAG: hypothetical protein IK134_00080 [Oscillospiraceae bacterium]|nr:hypothetical protein [Oscillospiraceae bacterium]